MLPQAGILLGKWNCRFCGATYGCTQVPVKRPTKCAKCDADKFEFEEFWFGDESYKIGGHPDGLIQLPAQPGLGILEIKSIGTWKASAVKNSPDMGHAIQLQCYLWLAGLDWGRILYWDKGANGMKALIEHHVDRDLDVIDRVKSTIREIRSGIRTSSLPNRICETKTCERAQECPLVEKCFEPVVAAEF
jgi:hypothetical protein